MKTMENENKHSYNPAKKPRVLPLVTVTFMLFSLSGLLFSDPADNHSFPRPDLRNAGADNGEIKLTVNNFNTEMQGEDNGSHTVIKGSKAVVYENDIYRIELPEVILTVEQQPESEDEPTETLTVTLTAKHAELDKRNETIRMSEDVRAIGPDFELHSENLRYEAQTRFLLSNSKVQLLRYEVGEDEERRLSLKVSGHGLKAEMAMQKVTIGGKSTTTIYHVSDSFFASEDSENQKEEGRTDENPQTVTIHADGALVYSHLLNRIDYSENVRVLTTARRLTADKLSVSVDWETETDNIEITRIDAEGGVSFEFDERVAKGTSLEWQNFTQIGKLKGNPATLTADELEVSGTEMVFYRLSNRLRVNGAGSLIWKTNGRRTEEDRQDVAENASMPFLSSADPLTVRWEGSMVYSETEGRNARFDRQVAVSQEDAHLECQTLEIVFHHDAGGLVSFDATKKVHYRQGERQLMAEHLSWKESGDEIMASGNSEEQWVIMAEPGRTLKSERIHFNPEKNTLRCPAKGTLTLTPNSDSDNRTDSSPIELSWSDNMEWDGEKKAVFHGDVESAQPGRELKTDRLDIFFDEDMNPSRIVAVGNALLVITDARPLSLDRLRNGNDAGSAAGTGGTEAGNAGDSAGSGVRWELSAEHLEGLPGGEKLKSDSPGTLIMKQAGVEDDHIDWTDSMTIDIEGMSAVFDGNVQAGFSQATLNCGQLRVDLDENRQLQYLNATKGVNFVSPGEEGWQLSADNVLAVFGTEGRLDHLIARTGVEVVDSARRLASEQLRLFFAYNPADGTNDLQRAAARDNVMIWYEEGTQRLHARGEELLWSEAEDKYELKGTPASLSRDGVAITGEMIVIDRRSGQVSLPRGTTPSGTIIQNR